jgi:predicted ABC-type ATPase
MPKPQALILGGPNGAGKSTVAPALLRDRLGIATFVNADEIARGLSAFAPEAVAVRAGRIMLEQLSDLVARRADFAFESTLSGLGVRDIIRGCRESGYELHLVYLWLPSPELALARVRQRVAAGGHNIPEWDVRRRWGRSLENLLDIYMPLVDSWSVVDGSSTGSAPVIARGGRNDEIQIVDGERWGRIVKHVRLLRGEHSTS